MSQTLETHLLIPNWLTMNQALSISILSFFNWVCIPALLVSPALAQVNGPGPSPSSLFDTVLNLPGDEAVITGATFESVGGVLGQTTQLNVINAGAIGDSFNANFGSELNISGGVVGFDFDASSGSEVNISGGVVLDDFDANAGSVVNINGGFVLDNFDANRGSVVNISGGEVGDLFDAGGVVNISGGTVGDFLNANNGSVVNISGGTLGAQFDFFNGSVVNISGGTVGNFFDPFPIEAFAGSEVNISGGTLAAFDAMSGSEVNISGGILGTEFSASAGSDVKLIGGQFSLNGTDFSGNTITLGLSDVFAGTLADGSPFIFSPDRSDTLINVTLIEAALPPADLDPIVLNDSNVSGPSGLRPGQTLTLEDGDALEAEYFSIVDATLNVEGGNLGMAAEAFNSVVNISGGVVGSRFAALSGSEVNVSGGTVNSLFEAFSGSVVNISGGTVRPSFTAVSSEVNISGGTLGEFSAADFGSVVNISDNAFVLQNFNAWEGSEVNISGGTVLDNFDANPGSVVNISGGTVGNFFEAFNSEVNISGGTIGFGFQAESGSVVNISGGTFGVNEFFAFAGSAVNIVGSEFFINGVEVNNLVPNQAFTINNRDVTLTGRLTDGEQFSFRLNSVNASNGEFSPNATLTVTLEMPFIFGDVNQDGTVDFLDITPFISLLSTGGFQVEADINQSGEVNFLDVAPFIGILSAP